MAEISNKLKLKLAKSAKGSGGDKYSATFIPSIGDGKERFIYVPQVYSRANNKPLSLLEMTLGTSPPGDWEFKLFKASCGNGDNVYTCTTANSEWGKVYLPKHFKDHESLWFSKDTMNESDDTSEARYEMYWPDRDEMTKLEKPYVTVQLPHMTKDEKLAFARQRLDICRQS